MKSLFFVSVAFCILSGTSQSASAQSLASFQDVSDNSTSLVGKPEKIKYSLLPELKAEQAVAKKSSFKTVATELCTKAQFKFAQLMDRNVEMLSNALLFNVIDEWWHTRYRYGGTSKSGIDCSAFTGMMLEEVFHIKVPRTARQQYAASDRVSREDMVEGDLVFFNTRGGVSHVGLYLGDGYFVHSSSSKGVTIDNLEESYYNKRFIGGGHPRSETQDVSVENAG